MKKAPDGPKLFGTPRLFYFKFFGDGMGFKVGTLVHAFSTGRYVFDQEREALAEVYIDEGKYYLRYLNGGVASVVYDCLTQFTSKEFHWVLTRDEMLAWENRKDNQVSRKRVIFDGDTVPQGWWHESQEEPLEPAFAFA